MKRLLLVIAGVLAALVGCGGEPAKPADKPGCVAAPEPDLGTAQGWVGWLATHRDDVTVVVDDGRGATVVHRGDQPSPLASASKVLHLAAYATAVSEGRVRPDDLVRIADWEAWYLPDTDGGAHPKALDHLGVPHENGRAKDPDRTVRLDDLAAVMIRFSDNAAPELLRDRLGDDTLRRASSASGWPDPELPSFLGQAIAVLAPELVTGDGRAARGAAEWAVARRYAGDAAFRAELGDRSSPGLAEQEQWVENNTTVGTAAQLNALHRAISTGSFGAGVEVARRHLEYQPPPAGALGRGAKGGSLPGVLTQAITVRRADGSVSSAVLLTRRMPLDEWRDATASLAHQKLLVAAMNEPQTLEQLRCAL